ncbi:MAG: hypothetical protein ACREBU_12040 [Nitrososphaera sp.]
MRGTKLYAIVAAAFMAGAFLASPELRAHASTIANDVICNGCVGTSDLAGSAVTNAKLANGAVNSAKIADNSITVADIATDAVGSSEIAANAVGSSEIATNAVGASELAGASKLIFSKCSKTFSGQAAPGLGPGFFCDVPGADPGDNVVATLNLGPACYVIKGAGVSQSDKVGIGLVNVCNYSATFSKFALSIIVYRTETIIIPLP